MPFLAPAYKLTAALLLGVVGLAAPAVAEQDNSAAELVEQDQTFIAAASAEHRAELALAELAAQKAEDPEVKRFAERMIEDHGRMGEELASILEEMNVPVSKKLAAQAKSGMDRLSDLSGASFDREYMRTMVLNHDKAVAVFADQTEAGESAPLTQFAASHLPTLHAHLDRALTLDGKVAVKTQTSPTDPLQAQARARADTARIEPDKPMEQRTAADIMQLPVFTENGKMIGNINAVVLDRTNRTCYAIVPVGGQWAIGAKDIAVACGTLRHKADDVPKGALIAAVTEDEVRSRPAIDISDQRYVRYPDDRRLGELGRL